MNDFQSALASCSGFQPRGPSVPGSTRFPPEQAILKAGGNHHRVEVINLSGGGAMIGSDVAYSMGQKVHLWLGDCLAVEGAVRWIRGNRIGLEFAAETRVIGSVSARRAGQRRSAFRHPLIWWGEIIFRHARTRVRLRNISAGGALVDSNVAFASDAKVLLDLGAAGHQSASVNWSRGDLVGLRFDNPFDIGALVGAVNRH